MLNYEIGVVKNFTFKDLDPWTKYSFSITGYEHKEGTKGKEILSMNLSANTSATGKYHLQKIFS